MKVTIEIEASFRKALEKRYDIAKLQNSLDGAYNETGEKDSLKIVSTESGVKSAKANEKKADKDDGFTSKDGVEIKRAGKLNDPLRMIAWLTNWAKFVKTNGAPSGEVTTDILPGNLVFWLETKFLKSDLKAKGSKVRVESDDASNNGKRSGNLTPA